MPQRTIVTSVSSLLVKLRGPRVVTSLLPHDGQVVESTGGAEAGCHNRQPCRSCVISSALPYAGQVYKHPGVASVGSPDRQLLCCYVIAGSLPRAGQVSERPSVVFRPLG